MGLQSYIREIKLAYWYWLMWDIRWRKKLATHSQVSKATLRINELERQR